MDPARLRVLMEGAVSGHPPVPHLVTGALRQGLRIRRRRRIQAGAALAAALAVVIVAPLAAGALTGHHPPARPANSPTAFAIVNGPQHAMVVPVTQRSDIAGRPIALRGHVFDVGIGEVAALGPGGRTLYVLTNAGLTPVDVATSTAAGRFRWRAAGAVTASAWCCRPTARPPGSRWARSRKSRALRRAWFRSTSAPGRRGGSSP